MSLKVIFSTFLVLTNLMLENVEAQQVCGSDGVTYRSECALERQNCRSHIFAGNCRNSPITKVHDGTCRQGKMHNVGISRFSYHSDFT